MGIILLIHKNFVFYKLIGEVLLHLGYVYDPSLSQLLEFLYVYVGTVNGKDVSRVELLGREHETIMCSSRCELSVVRDTFVGVYDFVYLDAALLLPRLWISSHSLEDKV